MKKIILVLLSIFLMLQTQSILAAPSVPYEWGNLPVGGHGFVTGVIMHPQEKDLVYVRTDVGGAYRLDKANNSWIQLCDGFGVEDGNFFGIDGLALDPQDTNIVYMAAGGNTWAQGDVLKSTDRGATWERTGLDKKFAGNGRFRGNGEPIAVDPANSSIIYCGTFNQGVWKSLDAGLTWELVKEIETVPDDKHPARNILFDQYSAKDGKSQIIYAGVVNVGLYKSRDGGETWALIPGSPTEARRIDVGPSGALYVASTKGLFKYANETWTEISAPDQIGKNHPGVAVDQKNENNIICVGNGNIMSLPILYSTDGGKTWVNKLKTASFTSEVAWTRIASKGSLSSNTCTVVMDPFDSKKVWISDWFAAYTTDDITAEPIQIWKSPIKGMEEVVPRDGISPPTGKFRFIAGIADIDSLPYDDITKYPERLTRIKRQVADEPWMMTVGQLDFCEEDPNIIIRAGVDWNTNGKLEYTTDGADTWNNITNIPYYINAKGEKLNAVQFGRAAVSAKKNPETGCPAFVVIPCYNQNADKKLPDGVEPLPLVSLDYGKTWTTVKGLPADINITFDFWNMFQPIASDRVNGSKFYIFSKNGIYVSDDWGFNWKQTTRIEGDWYKATIRTAPNKEGEVWAGIGDGGLYKSSDSGKTFNMVTAVSSVLYFGFGKEAPGETVPSVYVCGTVEGVYGIFRSIDLGETWERINNDQYKFGMQVTTVIGDRQTFGIVYIGTGGRGYYVGMPKGTNLSGGKTTTEDVALPEGAFNIYYNGELVEFVNKPFMKDDTVMVPVREFLNYFSADMQWDGSTNSLKAIRKELDVQLYSATASANIKDSYAVFKLDSNTININGNEKNSEIAPYLLNDTMYVPLDFAVEAFGAQIKWNEKKQICKINDNALIMYQ